MLSYGRFGSGMLVVGCVALLAGCGDDDKSAGYAGGGPGDTGEVGTFDGLFDDVATGYNFPLDIAIVPGDPEADANIGAGNILAANYGTSEILLVENPSGPVEARTVRQLYAGSEDDLAGATGVSVLPDGTVWAAFEQGGTDDQGGIVVLSPAGESLALIDAAVADAFAHPGGLCYGGATNEDPARELMFFVNLGDGTAWRISLASSAGDDPMMELVGSGLATGTPGNPGQPGAGLTSSNDLPEGGARGCAYSGGQLYVADAQNARIVRFDAANVDTDVSGVSLEDTPSELVTYPTGVAVNGEGELIVISYDNAHAFVSLDLPNGAFIDNGLNDLNVNSGNYGLAVAADTIWFTRANNSNGSLRAITQNTSTPPSTAGPFPAQ